MGVRTVIVAEDRLRGLESSVEELEDQVLGLEQELTEAWRLNAAADKALTDAWDLMIPEARAELVKVNEYAEEFFWNEPKG